MKLYITIQRSSVDDLCLMEGDEVFDAQASAKLFDRTIVDFVCGTFFDLPDDVEVRLGSSTNAQVEFLGFKQRMNDIENMIGNEIEELYKQPDRWLVKKGQSSESESI